MADDYTWSKMNDMNLDMHVHCDDCERGVKIDTSKMQPDGKVIGSRFRCTRCGQLGSVVVSHKSTAHPARKLRSAEG
jgi:predicted Zn finger-like uncharacterized protein